MPPANYENLQQSVDNTGQNNLQKPKNDPENRFLDSSFEL